MQLILIPLLPWTRQLGLLSGQWRPFVAIILAHPAFGAGWAVFMIASFLRNIPEEVAIIDFIFVWNDLLFALTLFGTRGEIATDPGGTQHPAEPEPTRQDVVSAAAMMAILPPLILFAVLNRYYVRGMFAGGAKG
ncbi:MAG TPA: hypothetical protein VK923_05215 [Euzebyales bacterium]|nr:hypothetical protein [Euzebyales bacterium]